MIKGKMTEKERLQLEDIKGFIEWGIALDKPQGWILGNVGHDCTLILSGEPGCPRTDGFRNQSLMRARSKIGDVLIRQPVIKHCDECGEYLGDEIGGVLYKFGQTVTEPHVCQGEKDGT